MERISDICPYCGAKLKLSNAKNIVKCEYCDSEIVIGNVINVSKAAVPPPSPTPVRSSGSAEESAEALKKWKKKVRKWEVLYFMFCFMFWLATDSSTDSLMVVSLIVSSVIFWGRPPKLVKIKPDETQEAINLAGETFKLYIKFLCVGFLSLIAAAIIFM